MTKYTYNIILSDEKLNTFPLKFGIRMPILTLLFSIALEVLSTANREEIIGIQNDRGGKINIKNR